MSSVAEKLKDLVYISMVRRCWQIAGKAERRNLVLIYVLLGLTNAIGLTRPIIIGMVVTTIAQGGPDFFRHLLFWLSAMVGNMMVYWVFMGPVRMLERRTALALRQRFTETLYNDVTNLPWNWHQAHHTGDTLGRMGTAAGSLFAFVDNQFEYWNTFLRLIGSAALLVWIAPQVGLVIVVTIPPLYYVMRRFDLVSIRLGEARNQAERNFSSGLMDYVGNIASLLALRLAEASRSNLAARFEPLRRLSTREMDVAVAKWAMFTIVLNVAWGVALLYYLYSQSDLQTAIMAGTVVTVFQYLQQIDGAINSFAGNYQGLLQHRVNVQGADPIRVSADALPPKRPIQPDLKDWTSVLLSGLTFRYEDQAHRTHHLDGVSLSLARGRRIALVGSSGSGKSTLLRLLRGLHDPAAGALAIDGQPAGFAALAAMSTLILQDAEIFENTIGYNLTCGLEVVPGDLDRAIQTACLQPVLDGLPQGLDTDIRERGVNLSGGQKQRLALARGLYAGRNSSLLLLDEPTSSLDAVTEATIFDRLLGDRADACIVASLHRLHLLDHFDHVCVMDDGRIVEEGSLPDLLAAEGRLFTLWQAQQREETDSSSAL